MSKFGIDISKWQKGFNFDKAKAEGVEFVILRGAYSTGKDSCFEDFYKQCKSKNIPVGIYHYSMAKTVDEAKKEAEFMLTVLSGKQFEYPICLDVEDATQKALGKDLLTDIIQTYCDILEKAGYYVSIYSTYYFLRDYTHVDQLDKYDKWIAQWSKSCTSPKPYGMWQFGGETNLIRTNKISGVTCDQDYAYKDYPAIIKNAGLNGFKTQLKDNEISTPAPQPENSSTIKVGDKVKVKAGAMFYNGVQPASFVYNTTYDVLSVSGDRVVIGIGTATTGAVKESDLEVITSSNLHYNKNYTVKAGDSFWSIADTQMGSGTKMYDLASYNGLSIDSVIYPGQVLKIPF